MYAEDRRMAFPSTGLDLKTVCEAYGVTSAPYSMSVLRGKKHYSSTGAETTIPASGEIVIGDFRGKTSAAPAKTYFYRNTFPVPDPHIIIVPFRTNGVQVGSCIFGCAFGDTYTITNGKLTNINFNLFATTYNTNSSGRAITFNSFFKNLAYDFYIDGVYITTYSGTFYNGNMYEAVLRINIDITCSNTLRIHMVRYTDNFAQTYILKLTYTVTTTGLQLTTNEGSTSGTYIQ
jgi:hypothetical protein